jgi:hypothetical protein
MRVASPLIDTVGADCSALLRPQGLQSVEYSPPDTRGLIPKNGRHDQNSTDGPERRGMSTSSQASLRCASWSLRRDSLAQGSDDSNRKDARSLAESLYCDAAPAGTTLGCRAPDHALTRRARSTGGDPQSEKDPIPSTLMSRRNTYSPGLEGASPAIRNTTSPV